MKTLLLEIVPDGLVVRLGPTDHRLLVAGDALQLESLEAKTSVRLELLSDCRSAEHYRSPSTGDDEPKPDPESLKPVPPEGVPF